MVNKRIKQSNLHVIQVYIQQNRQKEMGYKHLSCPRLKCTNHNWYISYSLALFLYLHASLLITMETLKNSYGILGTASPSFLYTSLSNTSDTLSVKSVSHLPPCVLNHSPWDDLYPDHPDSDHQQIQVRLQTFFQYLAIFYFLLVSCYFQGFF